MPAAGAIEKAANAAPAKLTPQAAIKHSLDLYRPVFTKLLAKTGIDEPTFQAYIANAVRATPGLLTCKPETVLGAALRCAQLGLAPNDGRNMAFIIPYNNEATFQLGYGGVMELARRAVPGLRFDGRPVYPNDEFDVDFGAEKAITHRPAVVRGMDRGGDAFAWYVRATFPDGSVQVHVLDKEGVEYHRKFSKQKNGKMWSDSYDAAALKSTVLDMKRWLPSSPTLAVAIASDTEVIDVRQAQDIGEITHSFDPDVNPPIEASADGEVLPLEVT